LIKRTETVNRAWTRIKNEEIVTRRREVRPIQNVEEFGTELDVEVFRDFFDMGVLGYGQINIDQSRANDRVALQVAQEIAAGIGVEAGICKDKTLIALGLGVYARVGRRNGNDKACRLDVLEVAGLNRVLGSTARG